MEKPWSIYPRELRRNQGVNLGKIVGKLGSKSRRIIGKTW